MLSLEIKAYKSVGLREVVGVVLSKSAGMDLINLIKVSGCAYGLALTAYRSNS